LRSHLCIGYLMALIVKQVCSAAEQGENR